MTCGCVDIEIEYNIKHILRRIGVRKVCQLLKCGQNSVLQNAVKVYSKPKFKGCLAYVWFSDLRSLIHLTLFLYMV